MASTSASSAAVVAVWEWRDDRNFWNPYDDAVCRQMESDFQSRSPPLSVSLAQTHPFLSSYEIVVESTTGSGFQRNVTTGNRRDVRRVVVSAGSTSGAIADGVVWKWKGDGRGDAAWCFYATNISSKIEETHRAFSAGTSSPTLDLETHFPGCRYTIDVATFKQRNKSTGFSRAIKREIGQRYPLASKSFAAASGAAVVVNGTTSTRTTVSSTDPSSHGIVSAKSGAGSSHYSAGSGVASASNEDSPPKRSGDDVDVNDNDFSWRLTFPPPSSKSTLISNASSTASGSSSSSDAVDLFSAAVVADIPDDDCIICMELLSSASGFGNGDGDDLVVNRLTQCDHAFHRTCLKAMSSSSSSTFRLSLQCPTCKTIHGELRGICPPGHMTYRLDSRFRLPGHRRESGGTIVIDYSVSNGVQGPEHPEPGKSFRAFGFPRTCYLPDSPKGRLVLQLLIVAWQRRLTFTVGVSSTTGTSNCVTWNEIHHKTESTSNSTGHGFPDPNYLDNVLAELAAQGVSSKDLKDAPSGSGGVASGDMNENGAKGTASQYKKMKK